MESITPFVILPVVYFARSIDFEEGDRLLYLRCVFVAVQIVGINLNYFYDTHHMPHTCTHTHTHTHTERERERIERIENEFARVCWL